jgi:hypothetical protein
MAKVVNTLSDYMMYLLVQHPGILPMNAAARSLFMKTYASFVEHWDLLSKMIIKDGIMDVTQQMDYLKRHFGTVHIGDMYHEVLESGSWDAYPGETVLVKASVLVRTLLRMKLGLTHKLVIIGRVWTEMLCYAATNASGDFHSRQLSNGGEFVTHMLLLSKYSFVMGDADYNPVDVAGHVELNVQNDHQEEIAEVP